MADLSEIINFIRYKTGVHAVDAQHDLAHDLGVDGDDYAELIDEYAARFKVDISTFLWYFHFSEEGSWNSIGGSLFRPPNERVPYIPVTVQMLADFAEQGKWNINYPPHSLPARRYDMLTNILLLIALLAFLLFSCVG